MLGKLLLDLLQPPFLDGHIVVVVHVVDADDVNVLLRAKQLQNEVGADETGSAGDENSFIPHCLSSFSTPSY